MISFHNVNIFLRDLSLCIFNDIPEHYCIQNLPYKSFELRALIRTNVKYGDKTYYQSVTCKVTGTWIKQLVNFS